MRIEVPEEHHATHPFASLKDFVLHLLTISLGLGLALAGEGLVEHHNHRELANETREYFRTQLEANRQAVAAHQKASAEMQLALLQAVSLVDTDPAGAKKALIQSPHEFLDLNTGSWDPAVATGALNYMPLREVQAYSQIHVSELSLNRLNREDEDVWFDAAEYNEQASELDQSDLKALKKVLRKAAMYSRRIGIQERELVKMYDQAEKIK